MLEYVAFYIEPITRESRVGHAKAKILQDLGMSQRDFLEFVLFKYIDSGVEELDQAKLPKLMELKYHTISDAIETLGDVDAVRNLFIGFQRHLYQAGDQLQM